MPHSSPPAPPAPPLRRQRPAGPAGAAGADQPGGPAVTAVLAARAPDPPAPPLPYQPAAGPAVCPGTRGAVGAVADQRAPGQRQAGRIDQAEQILLNRLRRIGLERRNIGGLRADIGFRTRGQRLHKLVMERRRLRTERLKALSVGGEHRRNGRRHLILGRGQHPRRPGPPRPRWPR